MKNISRIRHGAVTRCGRQVWRAANSTLFFAICLLAYSSLPVNAQYIGDQMVGLTGLKAGSQPAPGFYLALPLFYSDHNISIYDAQGRQVAKNLSVDINVIALPALQVVTPFKILGAHYGAGYSQWTIKGLLNVASTDFQRSTGYGFGDIYVQPLILGWHVKRADITAGYAFFAPTGNGTSGQHMWVNEINFGTTVYADAAKQWHLSTMMYYDFNRKKDTADIKVGDILTLSGGVGRSFLKGAANAGVAYGAQWKMTHDTGSGIPPNLPITNGRFFAVGPEIGMPVFAKGRNIGLVSFRYLWIVGAKTALGGQALALSFTFAHLAKE
jgi:hypothetical protein